MEPDRRTLPAAALLMLALFFLLANACRQEATRATPIPVVTRTIVKETVTTEVTRLVIETVFETVTRAPIVPPPQAKSLTICLPEEPDSLYPYGSDKMVSYHVQQALFERYIIQRNYGFQAHALEKLPSLADGDARLLEVTVAEGDVVVDAGGDVVTLVPGVLLKTAAGELITFEGVPVPMAQLVVDFTMKPTVWSDGVAVQAADSVYSFELAAASESPQTRPQIARTAAYEVLGERQVRWSGIPGFLDTTYFLNFWQPLPRHLWRTMTTDELLVSPASSQFPVGDGPFSVVEWQPGRWIRLAANENYYRADEGFPRLDTLTFRFIGDANEVVNALIAGECDIATQDALNVNQVSVLMVAESNDLLKPYFQTGTVQELIAFGVNSYGNYGDGDERPDWFQEARVRQAITLCTDRQRLIDDLLFGHSQINHSYLPFGHPLIPEELTTWPHDVERANALLDASGYVDLDGDGLRDDPVSGQPFRVRFGASSSLAVNRQIAQRVQEDLIRCGIEVDSYFLPANQWFGEGDRSPLFGRRFDLGLIAWPVTDDPGCSLYASWQITGPRGEINPVTGMAYQGWDGTNETGWWDPAYDAACELAMTSLPGTPTYASGHRQAQQIFAEQLPAMPLFTRFKVAAARPEVRGFSLDATVRSELYNLYAVDIVR